MPSISFCIITKNEESCLEQCLTSIRDVVDEIIVVDTGSTDSTKEISKKFTNKIYDFEWIDDFSVARNESLKRATKEWILTLDADETIAQEDLKGLQQLTNATAHVGFMFDIRNYTDDSEASGWVSSKGDKYTQSNCAAGWFLGHRVKLFKNLKGVKYEGVVHEKIFDSLSLKGNIGNATFPIHHFGRLNEDRGNKPSFYSKLGEAKLFFNEDTLSCTEQGIQLQESRNYEAAICMFQKAISLEKRNYTAWLNLGASYIKMGKFSEAKEALLKATSINTLDYSAYNNLGISYSKLGDTLQAIEHFSKAIALNSKNASVWLNLGLALDKINEKGKAYNCFKKAIELNPQYQDKIKLG